MSSLNLVPNPTIMVIEAGIFLANFFVVKKFLLEPYLKVHSERVRLTEGSQTHAEHLQQESSQAVDQIQARLQEVGSEARGLREQALSSAKQKRDELVAHATEEANRVVSSMRQELSRELEEQRRRVPELVRNLSQQLVDKIVPA